MGLVSNINPGPQPPSVQEDEGLAHGPHLSLVWMSVLGNRAVWELGEPRLSSTLLGVPSTARPATIIHLNSLPGPETRTGEAPAWRFPEALCAHLLREAGMNTQEENPPSTQTQVCGSHFINIMLLMLLLNRFSRVRLCETP